MREIHEALGELSRALDAGWQLYRRCHEVARQARWRGEVLAQAQQARTLLVEMKLRLELARRAVDDAQARGGPGEEGGPEPALAALFTLHAVREVAGMGVELLALGEAPVEEALDFQREVWWLTSRGGGLSSLRSRVARSLPPGGAAPTTPFEALCREQIAPREAEADRASRLPPQTWADVVGSGFLRLFHGPEHGGSGADGLAQAHAMRVLARASPSAMWVASISAVLVGRILSDLCTPAHQRRWLRPILAGEILGCFAASERGAGSDPGSYRVTLRREKGGYRLSGEKCRVSLAPDAHVAVVLCLTREICDGREVDLGQSYAVVDLNQPGITRGVHQKTGLRAMSWGSLRFDDVWVPEEDVLLGTDMGKTLRAVEWGQLFQSLCSLGIAEEALEQTLAHVRGRPAFGVTLAALPAVADALADGAARLHAARLLCLEVAQLKAAGEPGGPRLLMAKIFTTELATHLTLDALRLHGGWGLTTDHAIERLHRDSLGNVPAGLPTDRLRELLICPELGVSPWVYPPSSE